MNYDALIRETARRLSEAGIDEAGLEARLLVSHVSGLDRAGLIARGKDPVPSGMASGLEPLVLRRLGREPLQHILGKAHFYGLELVCDSRSLIPRADSEVVVEAALRLLPEDGDVQVADLGTGSACLLAAILANRPRAMGVGVDASAEAASLAGENMAQLGLAGRSSILCADWSDWTGWHKADLIISNPPYIPTSELAGLQPEVRGHDPASALDGGADGLAAYDAIVNQGGREMRPGAWLVFEIGYNQKEDVLHRMMAAGFRSCGAGKDLGGHDRVVWGQRP